jgi:hypothetical protein
MFEALPPCAKDATSNLSARFASNGTHNTVKNVPHYAIARTLGLRFLPFGFFLFLQAQALCLFLFLQAQAISLSLGL